MSSAVPGRARTVLDPELQRLKDEAARKRAEENARVVSARGCAGQFIGKGGITSDRAKLDAVQEEDELKAAGLTGSRAALQELDLSKLSKASAAAIGRAAPRMSAPVQPSAASMPSLVPAARPAPALQPMPAAFGALEEQNAGFFGGGGEDDDGGLGFLEGGLEDGLDGDALEDGFGGEGAGGGGGGGGGLGQGFFASMRQLERDENMPDLLSGPVQGQGSAGAGERGTIRIDPSQLFSFAPSPAAGPALGAARPGMAGGLAATARPFVPGTSTALPVDETAFPALAPAQAPVLPMPALKPVVRPVVPTATAQPRPPAAGGAGAGGNIGEELWRTLEKGNQPAMAPGAPRPSAAAVAATAAKAAPAVSILQRPAAPAPAPAKAAPVVVAPPPPPLGTISTRPHESAAAELTALAASVKAAEGGHNRVIKHAQSGVSGIMFPVLFGEVRTSSTGAGKDSDRVYGPFRRKMLWALLQLFKGLPPGASVADYRTWDGVLRDLRRLLLSRAAIPLPLDKENNNVVTIANEQWDIFRYASLKGEVKEGKSDWMEQIQKALARRGWKEPSTVTVEDGVKAGWSKADAEAAIALVKAGCTADSNEALIEAVAGKVHAYNGKGEWEVKRSMLQWLHTILGSDLRKGSNAAWLDAAENLEMQLCDVFTPARRMGVMFVPLDTWYETLKDAAAKKDELLALLPMVQEYKEALEAVEREAKRKAEEEKRKKEEADAKRRAEEERKRKEEAEARRKVEEEKRAKAEAEARKKAEEDRKKREEAEAKRRAEEEARKREQDAKKRAEVEAKRQAAEAKKAAAAAARNTQGDEDSDSDDLPPLVAISTPDASGASAAAAAARPAVPVAPAAPVKASGPTPSEAARRMLQPLVEEAAPSLRAGQVSSLLDQILSGHDATDLAALLSAPQAAVAKVVKQGLKLATQASKAAAAAPAPARAAPVPAARSAPPPRSDMGSDSDEDGPPPLIAVGEQSAGNKQAAAAAAANVPFAPVSHAPAAAAKQAVSKPVAAPAPAPRAAPAPVVADSDVDSDGDELPPLLNIGGATGK